MNVDPETVEDRIADIQKQLLQSQRPRLTKTNGTT